MQCSQKKKKLELLQEKVVLLLKISNNKMIQWKFISIELWKIMALWFGYLKQHPQFFNVRPSLVIFSHLVWLMVSISLLKQVSCHHYLIFLFLMVWQVLGQLLISILGSLIMFFSMGILSFNSIIFSSLMVIVGFRILCPKSQLLETSSVINSEPV